MKAKSLITFILFAAIAALLAGGFVQENVRQGYSSDTVVAEINNLFTGPTGRLNLIPSNNQDSTVYCAAVLYGQAESPLKIYKRITGCDLSMNATGFNMDSYTTPQGDKVSIVANSKVQNGVYAIMSLHVKSLPNISRIVFCSTTRIQQDNKLSYVPEDYFY
jgi:hypothetical protein